MNQLKETLNAAARRLRIAAGEIAGVPGLAAQAQAMVERAERLEANRFTVALFGAFSAGKSSVANALMGDLVLPVSPNPTTAAINKILPPTDAFPHGTVRVVLKSREAMESDVNRSLAVFGLDASRLEELPAKVEVIDPARVSPAAKPHFTFLKAAAKGLLEMGPHLGGVLTVDLAAFKGFVAKEDKACFTEYVELYYACPLTEQGVVLVDTPGADSINARHTGVAFDYMKSADAILFVTYYNHAFSQADREVLMQMGRVKDALELDKMFFLVNAADLAATPDELAGVLAHVEKNLLACGIRHARIYPVSSQTALLARLQAKGKLTASAEQVYRQRTGTPADAPLPAPEEGLAASGMPRFERDFLAFTLEGLAQSAAEAAYGEIRRARAMLREFVTMAQAGEQARREQREAAHAAREAALAAVAALSAASEERDLAKEREELLYYVKQRVFFRFHEWFNEAFNPAVLRDDAGSLKQALEHCLRDLLRSVGQALAQELRATALRLEQALNKSGARLVQGWQEAVAGHAAGLTLAPYPPRTVETPPFAEELPVDDVGAFRPALSLFKSPKDFFELDGKAKMRDELEKRLQEPVAAFLARGGEQLAEAFARAFAEMAESERRRAAQQVEEYFTGVFAALDMTVDLNDLTAREARLAEALDALGTA